ncbi:MAG: hypothetical protein ACYSPI_02845 [Planctomycetota bacterium]
MKRALFIAVFLSLTLCSHAAEPNDFASSEFKGTLKKAVEGDVDAQCELGLM